MYTKQRNAIIALFLLASIQGPGMGMDSQGRITGGAICGKGMARVLRVPAVSQ